ncbi:MAG: 4-hydroxy-tetrahydrodipicolinate reductase, partial [Ruminococcaceae bacterium]|nr:4-hydroxy-tetrahydrodipicolinate reductase [Oscillospiraceae bacterium]
NKELGLHAIRGGTIVGDHTVMLAGPEETLQIAHSAQSRAVFARGALAAARFLADKPAGRYSMDDILKIKLET